MKNKKKVVEEKTYSVKYILYDDGSSMVERKNNGFSAIELLGYFEQVQLEILDQMRGVINPNVTKLNVKINKKK